MSDPLQRSAAFTALAVTLLGAPDAQAEPSHVRTITHSSSKFSWSDIRVSVSRNGSVRSEKVVYDSGDAAFNASALEAVAATTFVPDAHNTSPSTFDYLLLAKVDGRRSSRILGHLRGDPTVSAIAGVRVLPSGDAWLANTSTGKVSAR